MASGADGTSSAFKLTPPDSLPAVTGEMAVGRVPISDDRRSRLESKASQFVTDLIIQNANAPEFGRRVDQLTKLGQREIVEAAGHSTRLLDRPVRAMDETSGVSADLAELRRLVEDLDPSRHGDLMLPRRLFGIIPFGNRLRSYFDRYQTVQSHIDAILARLQGSKDELLTDNDIIDVERQNLWVTLGKLEQMIVLAKALDSKLDTAAADLDVADPAKARVLRESALFHIRQSTQDLLTQMAVTVQGYLALDLVRQNNLELVKGVERASTTTVSALRTAVTVAQALTSQGLVLDQIAALNSAAAGVIDSTGQLLRDQTRTINEQASSSAFPLETLQRAFQNVYDTMDRIDSFKLNAVRSLEQTAKALEDEAIKSREYIARVGGGHRRAADC